MDDIALSITAGVCLFCFGTLCLWATCQRKNQLKASKSNENLVQLEET